MIDASTYERALEFSRSLTNKGISRQGFAIYAKVAEVNRVMTPEHQRRVFEVHPEVSFWALAGGRPMDHPKSLGPDGLPCHKRTVGLLSRRPVMATEKRYVGKEANELDRVEAELVDELEEVLTVYARGRSEDLRERLRKMSVKEGMALTGLSRRQVFYLRSGRRSACCTLT